MTLSGQGQASRLNYNQSPLLFLSKEKVMETCRCNFSFTYFENISHKVFRIYKQYLLSFLQIDFMYYVNTDLLIAFHCDREVSYRCP